MTDHPQRKKKPPPLPKFEQPKASGSQIAQKVTDFLQQISKQVSSQQQQQKPITPIQKDANNSNNLIIKQNDKKKINLACINSKLNSIMSSKKIDMNKVVQNSKKYNEHQDQPKIRRDIQIQYDPTHPNSYQQAISHYQQTFQKLKKLPSQKKQQDEDQKLSKLIADFQKNGTQIQQQPLQQLQTNTLDDRQSIALRMMQKQGFKIGQGLGKLSQGIKTPLTIKKLTDSSCKIEPSVFSLANFVTLQQSAENALKAFKIEKSTIIALRICMELTQLTEQVQTQIKQECSKYGQIQQWIALSTQQAIIFFCQYSTIQQSFHAFTRINGKYYNDKLINSFFYPKLLFQNKNFTAPLHQSIQF